MYSIGRSYNSKTGWPLEVCIMEHKHHLMILKKPKLAQHAYHEGDKFCWKEEMVYQIEPNTTYWKYKDPACMALVAHSISQPNLDIFLIWISTTEAEVKKQ
jgi:hypothetical protein